MMMEATSLKPYHSYLLRFWPEPRPSGEVQWRFTLVNASTGKRQGFASLEALVEFLAQFTQADAPQNTEPRRTQDQT